MKYNKKILNLLLATAVAIPMVMPISSLPVFAATGSARFQKVDEDGNGLAGAMFEVYRVGDASGTGKDVKLLTFKTDEKGYVDKMSIKPAFGIGAEDLSAAVEDNYLNLEAGSYYCKEIQSPEGYMRNVKYKVINISGTNGIDAQLEVINKKFEDGKGQVIINSLDASTQSPVPNATIDVFNSSEKLVATFETDNDGDVMSTFEPGEVSEGVSVYNGTIVLPAGNYTIKENKASGNYAQLTNSFAANVESGKTIEVTLAHTVKPVEPTPNPVPDTTDPTPGTDTTESTDPTGVKIRILNSKDDSPLADQLVGVYSVDENGNTAKKVFLGKTGKDGYLLSSGATTGGDLVKDGVLTLKEGKYYYKLDKYSNAKKHTFSVENGKVGDQILKLKTSSSSSNSSSTSSSKKKSSKSKKDDKKSTSSRRLARTGFENTAKYTVGGMGLLVIGGILLKKKN